MANVRVREHYNVMLSVVVNNNNYAVKCAETNILFHCHSGTDTVFTLSRPYCQYFHSF